MSLHCHQEVMMPKVEYVSRVWKVAEWERDKAGVRNKIILFCCTPIEAVLHWGQLWQNVASMKVYSSLWDIIKPSMYIDFSYSEWCRSCCWTCARGHMLHCYWVMALHAAVMLSCSGAMLHNHLSYSAVFEWRYSDTRSGEMSSPFHSFL
jgi:hypothetical protein